MKRTGSSPSTGSARRGSRGDTQQKGNTMDDSGGHSGENLKQQKGSTTKSSGDSNATNDKRGKSNNNSTQSNNLGEYQIYSGGSDRHARRQARSGKYRQDQAFRSLQEKISAFEKGTGKSLKKLKPTNKELMEIVNKEYKSTNKGSMADKFRRKAMQILAMQHKHELTIEAMMKDWMDGGHGYVPDKKPDGVVSLCVWVCVCVT